MHTAYHLIFILGTFAILFIERDMLKGSAHVVEICKKQTLTFEILVIFHMQSYLQKYKFKNAKTSDFWAALEEVRRSISSNISLINK